MQVLQPWPLTGRTRELDAARDALTGTGGGVVLAGESGVGKTRLARELANGLAAQGYGVEWASASVETATISLGAVASWMGGRSFGSVDEPLDAVRKVRMALDERHRRRPVALVVDDAHLLDPVSGLLVQLLLGSGSAVVVLTVRNGKPVPDIIQKLWKDGMAVRIDVPPLSESDSADLLRAVLGGSVEHPTAHRYWVRSAGNPLWLRELVLDDLDSGLLRSTPGTGAWFVVGDRTSAAGTRLVELVGSRLASLAADQFHHLELLALGEPLALGLIGQLVPDEDLRELEGAGLVTVEPDGGSVQVRMVHPIYGEVLRAGIPTLRACQLWRELVTALETSGAGGATADVRRRALWRLEAGQAVDPALLESAARQALQQADPVSAERFARQAADRGSAGARVTLVEALAALGRWDEFDVELELVDPACLDADASARVLFRRVWRAMLAGAVGGAVRLIDEASEGTEEPAVQQVLESMRAVVAFFAGEVGQAEALAGRILEQPDLDHLARRWATWTVVNGGPFSGRTESVRVVAEAEINRMGVGDALALVPFELMLPYCYALCRSGRLDEARSVTEDCYRSALALHDPGGVSIARWLHGVALMDSGHLAEARSAYRDSADAMGRDDPGPYRVVVLSELSRTTVSLGDVEGSRAALDAIAELPGYPPLFDLLVARARAWHLACTGEMDAAVVEATRAAGAAGRLGQGAQEAAQLHDVARMGRAALVTDRLTELARTYEGALMATYAVHARALALHAAPDLEAAARQFAVLGADLLSAEAWVEAAVAHGQSSDRSAERRCQARAAEALAPCGPARTPALTLPLRRAGLTRREVEIASMAASGLSDREISRRCELSLRTVENHLHRAYSKLGINSRTRLGEALERRRTGGIPFRD